MVTRQIGCSVEWILHFTRHSAEKFCTWFSAIYHWTIFRIPQNQSLSVHHLTGYWAFSLPGPSLPGANRPIGPWPIHSLALGLLFPGSFIPWNFHPVALSLRTVKSQFIQKKFIQTNHTMPNCAITESNLKRASTLDKTDITQLTSTPTFTNCMAYVSK